MSFFILICLLAFIACLHAHSWVRCTDYDGTITGNDYNEGQCNGWIRDWTFDSVTFGQDRGINYQAAVGNGNNICANQQLNGNSGNDYASDYANNNKLARYTSGSTVRVVWPAKNHANYECFDWIPDTSMKLFFNPNADPTSDLSNNANSMEGNGWQLVKDWHEGCDPMSDGCGFQNCPKFCENTDKATCFGDFTVPSVATSGYYTFVWYWIFNVDSDPYISCWEAYIEADGNPTTPNDVTAGDPHDGSAIETYLSEFPYCISGTNYDATGIQSLANQHFQSVANSADLSIRNVVQTTGSFSFYLQVSHDTAQTQSIANLADPFCSAFVNAFSGSCQVCEDITTFAVFDSDSIAVKNHHSTQAYYLTFGLDNVANNCGETVAAVYIWQNNAWRPSDQSYEEGSFGWRWAWNYENADFGNVAFDSMMDPGIDIKIVLSSGRELEMWDVITDLQPNSVFPTNTNICTDSTDVQWTPDTSGSEQVQVQAQGTGCVHKSQLDWRSYNNQIYLNSQRFDLKGLNWFGFETGQMSLFGLNDAAGRTLDHFFDWMLSHGFNAIRLPFSQAFITNADNQIKYRDTIRAAGRKGILVMPDYHSMTPDSWRDGLNTIDKPFVISLWGQIAELLKDEWNVLAADVFNEPHDVTNEQWPTWIAFCQDVANEIWSKGVNWLIAVEGTNYDCSVISCAWGENLEGARHHPFDATGFGQNRFIYSPHVYGQDVTGNSEYSEAAWQAHWGYLTDGSHPANEAATVIGEYGTFYREQHQKDWLDSLITYLIKIDQRNSFYWCLNPESGDTGGLFQSDWVTEETEKLAALHRLQPNPTRLQYDEVSGQVCGVPGETETEADCAVYPAGCKAHTDWAASTGLSIIPEAYPDFTTVTGVSMSEATSEDVALYWACSPENSPHEECSALTKPCGRVCGTCGNIPDSCFGHVDWAIHTGSQQFPEWYPQFQQITGVSLAGATQESMSAYFYCTGAHMDAGQDCVGLDLPCSWTTAGKACSNSRIALVHDIGAPEQPQVSESQGVGKDASESETDLFPIIACIATGITLMCLLACCCLRLLERQTFGKSQRTLQNVTQLDQEEVEEDENVEIEVSITAETGV